MREAPAEAAFVVPFELLADALPDAPELPDVPLAEVDAAGAAEARLVGAKVLLLAPEIAPEPAGHGLPLSKCEAYNRVYDQPYESR